MKRSVSIPRLVIAIAAGLSVAVLSGAQMASMLATRTQPTTAIAAFPLNGEAYEVAAFAVFTGSVTDPEQLQPAAETARSLAIEAIRQDPASARAYALLALAQTDRARRDQVALAASRVNRRDLTLQGVVLDTHLANNDFANVVETLDQILRVHPTYRRDFYPVLGEALRDNRTVPVFARLLDGSSPWHERFFTSYALSQPDLLRNVAELRAMRDLVGPDFDRQLVANLVRAGENEAAARLYRQLSSDDQRDGGREGLAWTAQFPPFDWRFTNESDFRAQVSRDGERLELFARPGKGGEIAQRILPVPQAPFSLRLTQFADNPSQADAVRIELRCPGAENPFLVQPLGEGENALRVEEAPACEAMQLVINARAFSGSPTLRSELGRIEITPS